MICSARSGTTSHTIRSTTSVESLSNAASSGLPGSSPAVSASRDAIFASARSTSCDRLVGVPPIIGARLSALDGAIATAAGAGGGGAGDRIEGDEPGPLPAGEIGGTAITVVLVAAATAGAAAAGVGGGGACTVGWVPPAGILIVGMPM